MAEDRAATPRKPRDFEKVLDGDALGGSASEVASFEIHDKSPLARFHHFLHANPTAAPVVVLVASCLVFGVAADNFFSAFNLSLIIQQVTVIGILGAAQTLVILTAGIDLSVAAIMVLSYMVMARLAVQGDVPTLLAILIGCAVGLACGLFNGSLVTRTRLAPVAVAVLVWILLHSFGLPPIYVLPIGMIAAIAVGWFSFGPALEVRLPPFIVTLGAWSIFFALNLWYSESETIRSQDLDATAPLLKLFGVRVEILGAQLTLGSFLMVGIFVVLWYALNWTAWGRSVYAVGDDKESAELSGIRTDRVLLSVYGTAGLICAIGGWAAIGRVGSDCE